MSDNTSVIASIKSKIAHGEIVKLDDLTAGLGREAQYEPAAIVPPDFPITDEQKAALEKLPLVWGSVAPTEVRALEPIELVALMVERRTADEVAKMVGGRLNAIRDIILNHFDVTAGERIPEDKQKRTRAGRIIEKAQIVADGKKWSKESRSSKPQIDIEKLRALDEAGELDHEDFLAMTTPIRVIDENKVMLALARKPELVDLIAKSLTETEATVSLYVR